MGTYAYVSLVGFIQMRMSGELRNVKLEMSLLRDEIITGHLAHLSTIMLQPIAYIELGDLLPLTLQIRSYKASEVSGDLDVLLSYLVRVIMREVDRSAQLQEYMTNVSPIFARDQTTPYTSVVSLGFLPALQSSIQTQMLVLVGMLRDAGESIPMVKKQ